VICLLENEKYHALCLLCIYHKANNDDFGLSCCDTDDCHVSIDSNSIALAEVVGDMEEVGSG